MAKHDPSVDPTPPPLGSLTNLKILKVTALLIALLILRTCLNAPDTPVVPDSSPATDSLLQVEMAEPADPGNLFSPPTLQRRWQETDNPEVYMPTGSGRVESASYGSVRTQSSGRASFHEGVDIAPLKWVNGKARDEVFAVADGEVAYINRVAGNSSYGIYLVIRHPDPVGEVYSLYAHLASVRKDLSSGDPVNRGDELGIMGHSSTLGIPRQRSHLHFELCMMLNPDFHRWYRAQNLTPDHRRYHGYNLAGLNPHLLLSSLHGREEVPFSFAGALQQTETAWTILIRTDRVPRYFDQYPDLWEGPPPGHGAIMLEVSESGVILAGRSATAEEARKLGTQSTRILSVQEDVLGRNGLRHIRERNGSWQLARNGERWLDILLYRSQ